MNFTAAWNADYIDAQYERWKSDPQSLSREWQFFFEGFELAASGLKPPAEAVGEDQLQHAGPGAGPHQPLPGFGSSNGLPRSAGSLPDRSSPFKPLAAFNLTDGGS